MSKTEAFRLLNNDNELIALKIHNELVTPFRGNRVSFCTTTDDQEVVAKFPPESYRAYHEFKAYQLAESQAINVPKTVGLISDQLGNIGFLTYRIRGNNLYKVNYEGVKYQFGNIIKSLHTIDVPNNIYSYPSNYHDYDEKLYKWSRSPISGYLSETPIYSLVDRHLQTVADSLENQRRTMTHHDLHDDQAIVSENRIYLIDFEEWKLSHPMEDISIYLYHSLRTKRPIQDFVNFMHGYSKDKPTSESDKILLNYFLLFFSIEMLDYFASNRTVEVPYAIDYLKRSVEFVEKEKIWKM